MLPERLQRRCNLEHGDSAALNCSCLISHKAFELDVRTRSVGDSLVSLFQEVKRKADELKDLWTHPVKPYGYWSEDRSNMKLLLDLRLPSLSGRKSPYDSLPKSEGS